MNKDIFHEVKSKRRSLYKSRTHSWQPVFAKVASQVQYITPQFDQKLFLPDSGINEEDLSVLEDLIVPSQGQNYDEAFDQRFGQSRRALKKD